MWTLMIDCTRIVCKYRKSLIKTQVSISKVFQRVGRPNIPVHDHSKLNVHPHFVTVYGLLKMISRGSAHAGYIGTDRSLLMGHNVQKNIINK